MRYCDDLPVRRPGRGERAKQAVCAVKRRQLLMLGAAVGLAPALAMAQQYPSRPVRLVNGFAVGGGVDYAVRLIAPALGDELKGTMVVENKVGASGMIAAQQVAKLPPDGYTLMITGGSAVMIAPQTVASPNFNPLADLVPINSVGGSPLAIAVHPSLGVRTLKDLIALSRTRQVTIASAGTGTMTHLTIELLAQAASGGDILHVPYKGGGAAVIDALAGHVNGMVSDIPPMYQHFQEGRLVPLAITSDMRFDIVPNVSTATGRPSRAAGDHQRHALRHPAQRAEGERNGDRLLGGELDLRLRCPPRHHRPSSTRSARPS